MWCPSNILRCYVFIFQHFYFNTCSSHILFLEGNTCDETIGFFSMLSWKTHDFAWTDWALLSALLLPGVNGSFKVFSGSFSSDADNSIRFPCPNHNCGRAFNWKRNLTRHLKYECGLQPRFKCPYCDYYGKLKGNVSKHLLRRHNNRKIYVVDLSQETSWVICPMSFI